MPIPTKASNADMARYVANIVELCTSGTPDQYLAGRTWYHTGHDLARTVGKGNVRIGAGVIAALSPQKEWQLNVRLALDAGNGNVHGQTKANTDKATRILAGEDPADVLPMHAKTGKFYLNLAELDNPDAVTIDRWAYRAAVGIWSRDHDEFDVDFGLSSHTRYNTLATAYRLAAKQLGELPSVVQAWAWVVLRDRIGYTYTYAS